MEMTYNVSVSRVENPQEKIEFKLSSLGGVDVTKDFVAAQILLAEIEKIATKAGFEAPSFMSVTDQTGLTVYERNAHTSCKSLI